MERSRASQVETATKGKTTMKPTVLYSRSALAREIGIPGSSLGNLLQRERIAPSAILKQGQLRGDAELFDGRALKVLAAVVSRRAAISDPIQDAVC